MVATIKIWNKRGYDDKEEEQYPGVSNQKNMKIRAEQLFHEAQALKKEHQAEAEQKRARKREKEEARQGKQKMIIKVETDKELAENKEQ
eukprot:16444743-Heterocapsa_arctica.AAC.1